MLVAQNLDIFMMYMFEFLKQENFCLARQFIKSPVEMSNILVKRFEEEKMELDAILS